MFLFIAYYGSFSLQVILGSKELIDLNLGGVGETSQLLRQASHEEASLQVTGERFGRCQYHNAIFCIHIVCISYVSQNQKNPETS